VLRRNSSRSLVILAGSTLVFLSKVVLVVGDEPLPAQDVGAIP
jgi:hypothetical protein